MKRIFALALSVIIISFIYTSCSDPIFEEQTVDEGYNRNGYTIVHLEASYPVFDEPYDLLNTAIRQEIDSWYNQYDELIEKALRECERDESMASLQRYLTASYSISKRRHEISVTFDVVCFDGGNSLPSYTKTLMLDAKTGMVYETITTTKRVYN